MPRLPFYHNDQGKVSSSDSRKAQCPIADGSVTERVSILGSRPAFSERNQCVFQV